MRRTVTTLCATAALAAVPAVGIACPAGSSGTSAKDAAAVTTAKNRHKLKRCKNKAYSRYQGDDLTKALKRCKRKFG